MTSYQSHHNSKPSFTNNEVPVELVFSNGDPLNTLVLLHGRPRYRIFTGDVDQWETDVTDLYTNQVIVSVRKRSFLPDKVMFPGRRDMNGKMREVRKSKWLVEGKDQSGRYAGDPSPLQLSNEYPRAICRFAWTVANDRGTFMWRMDPVMRLVVRGRIDFKYLATMTEFFSFSSRL